MLAANALAAALAPFYAVGADLLRAAFLDPRVQDVHPGWEHTTESMVAGLRGRSRPTRTIRSSTSSSASCLSAAAVREACGPAPTHAPNRRARR